MINNVADNGGGVSNSSNSSSVAINIIAWNNNMGHGVGGSSNISHNLIQNGCPDGVSCSNILNLQKEDFGI